MVDVRIIMDRNTRKSKGFAYIEYQNRVGSYCVLLVPTMYLVCNHLRNGI